MASRVARRKQRKKEKTIRIYKRLTLTFICFSLLAVISYFGLTSFMTGLYNIKNIQVEGAEILTEDQIIAASGIEVGKNIFMLNVNNVRYNINQVVSTNDIIIRKVLPDTVVIKIEEKDPMCVINQDGKNYYIDEDEKLLESTEEFGDENIPIISGLSLKQENNTITVEPVKRFNTIIEMLKIFKQNGLTTSLSEINLTPESSYRIITKNGVVFLVTDISNLKEYFDYISTVIANGESNLEINLTLDSDPVKRPR